MNSFAGAEESSRNNFPFSVPGDSVESASLGILYGEEAVTLFGSLSWSPAFRRFAGDGWQSQRVNRLKAGLQHWSLGLPRHYAEIVSGQFLARRSRHQKQHGLPARGRATTGRGTMLRRCAQAAEKSSKKTLRDRGEINPATPVTNGERESSGNQSARRCATTVPVLTL